MCFKFNHFYQLTYNVVFITKKLAIACCIFFLLKIKNLRFACNFFIEICVTIDDLHITDTENNIAVEHYMQETNI